MEQLVPNEFFFTTGDTPLEKLVERQIWSGWKKLILIGSPGSIRRGFNTLMQASEECRSTLEIGFWPLDLQELAASISQSSFHLRPVLQVFKAGHTLLVDVMKVQFLAPELETKYFWNNFVINSTQANAETTIYIDGQNSQVNGKFRCRIAFHDESLNSLTMHPGKLTRTPVLKVYLKRNEGLTTVDRFKQIKQWFAAEKGNADEETLLKTGKQVEVQGNWAILTLNTSSDGSVTVGVSTNGKGPNLKAPKGSEVTIATDGTSSISLPATTDSTSGITTQVVSTLSPDGSTLIEMSFSGGSGRTTNAEGSSAISKSTLSTDSGLSVAIDTSSGVKASMAVTEGTVGTLTASLASDGTSSTSFDTGTSKTTFSSSISMNLQVKSGKVVSTSSAETGNDGVSRTIISTTNSTNTTIQAQGTSVSDSTLKAVTGSTISLSKNRTVTSTFATSTSMTSIVTLNSEGLMIPTITTLSSNAKQIFPEVVAGGTVSQESGKLVVTIPLTTSGSSRNSSKRSSSLRTSQRGGVSSEYATTGQWVGVDSTSGKPVYVQSASAGATLVLENAYDNTTTVSLSAGTADLRIGDVLPTALSSTVSVKSTPASVTMSGSRNLISLPAYTSIAPASFESQFSSYKTVWVRRSGAWQFYTSSDNKTVYTDKGYTELTSSIEAGEGFWVELNAPVNPANFEVANYGGYTALAQLSSMTSEWNIAGTSKKITVEEITQAANFDQTSEDESNTLGFIENSGGNGPPSGLQISNFEFEIAVNEFGQSSRIALLMAVLLLASAILMLYRRQTQLRNSSQSQNILLRIPAWQLFSVAGIIMFVVACAPPQGDSTSSTFDYSGSYDRVHSVWKWDDENSKWLAYSPKTSVAQELSTEGYSTFSFVEKGQGYWVRLSVSGVPTSLSFAEPPAF